MNTVFNKEEFNGLMDRERHRAVRSNQEYTLVIFEVVDFMDDKSAFDQKRLPQHLPDRPE